eukprot:5798157-Pleurochrysis_carterae.AAC.1
MPSTHLSLLRIYWRHVYAAMTRLKLDGAPFSTNSAAILQRGRDAFERKFIMEVSDTLPGRSFVLFLFYVAKRHQRNRERRTTGVHISDKRASNH